MIVVDCGANDHQIIDYRRRRSHVIPTGMVIRDFAQTDLAAVAEVRAGRAAGSIKRNQARVLRGLEYSAAAGLTGSACRVEPSGYTAVDEAVAIVPLESDLGIVGPTLCAGFGVDSDDTVERRGEIESSIDDKRRGFKAAALATAVAVGDFAGVNSPGDS